MIDRNELRIKAAEMRSRGASLNEICEATGLPTTTAYRWIKKIDKQVESIEVADAAAEDLEARKKYIESLVRTYRSPVYIAGQLRDGQADEWQYLGEQVAPDFLEPWQFGSLLAALASGVHRQVALARVGIKPTEFEVWCANALMGKQTYLQVVTLCSQAQASACAHISARIIDRQQQKGWQALAWMLSKLRPELFAKVNGGGEELVSSGLDDVDESTLKRVALAYINGGDGGEATDVEYVDLDELTGEKS